MVTIRSFVGHVISQLIGRWFSPLEFHSDDFPSQDFSAYEPAYKPSLEPNFLANDLSRLQAAQYTVWNKPISAITEVRHILKDAIYSAPSHSTLRTALVKLRVKFGSSVCLIDQVEEILNQCESNNLKIIGIEDPLYPQELKNISRPPLALFCNGNVGALSDEIVAVIGSRKASYFGLHAARSIAHSLTLDGKRVVTGGAIGCDTAASLGSLQIAGMGPILVFAGGLLDLYPRCNQRIFDSTLQNQGVLVTEKLPKHQVRRFDFPIRNRIISGMSKIVIVAQASEKSGALVTAHEALAEGRDVWVVSHPKDDVRSFGGNRLIEDGATAIENFEELWACH